MPGSGRGRAGDATGGDGAAGLGSCGTGQDKGACTFLVRSGITLALGNGDDVQA